MCYQCLHVNAVRWWWWWWSLLHTQAAKGDSVGEGDIPSLSPWQGHRVSKCSTCPCASYSASAKVSPQCKAAGPYIAVGILWWESLTVPPPVHNLPHSRTLSCSARKGCNTNNSWIHCLPVCGAPSGPCIAMCQSINGRNGLVLEALDGTLPDRGLGSTLIPLVLSPIGLGPQSFKKLFSYQHTLHILEWTV